MKVAIMQPYFMPYIGYFQLINAVDEFILFDTPQFIRHGWIERNNILKINGESSYVKVSLIKHSRDTAILDVKINNQIKWQDKILAQLTHYKKKAPYYKEVLSLLTSIFENETESISKFNAISLQVICDYIEIRTPIKVWSQMDVKIDEVNAPDEWALNISKAIGADTYINPIGGESFFDKNKYDRFGLKLNFIESTPIAYAQFDNDFVPFLSILDIMMFNSKEEIKVMLNQFALV